MVYRPGTNPRRAAPEAWNDGAVDEASTEESPTLIFSCTKWLEMPHRRCACTLVTPQVMTQ